MPAKQKPAAEPTEDKEFEQFERLMRWRFQALLKIGLAPDQAMALIEIPDVVHDAQALADRGCPPGIIASLLEGD